jgi:hypothetical protein
MIASTPFIFSFLCKTQFLCDWLSALSIVLCHILVDPSSRLKTGISVYCYCTVSVSSLLIPLIFLVVCHVNTLEESDSKIFKKRSSFALLSTSLLPPSLSWYTLQMLNQVLVILGSFWVAFLKYVCITSKGKQETQENRKHIETLHCQTAWQQWSLFLSQKEQLWETETDKLERTKVQRQKRDSWKEGTQKRPAGPQFIREQDLEWNLKDIDLSKRDHKKEKAWEGDSESGILWSTRRISLHSRRKTKTTTKLSMLPTLTLCQLLFSRKCSSSFRREEHGLAVSFVKWSFFLFPEKGTLLECLSSKNQCLLLLSFTSVSSCCSFPFWLFCFCRLILSSHILEVSLLSKHHSWRFCHDFYTKLHAWQWLIHGTRQEVKREKKQ